MNSSLEFKLHKQQFIQLLLAGKQLDAIEYSRTHLKAYSSTHLTGMPRSAMREWVGCLSMAH
jgi:hypothetical protein